MTEMQMTGTKHKEMIELKKVLLIESYPQKIRCLREDCIISYYNPVKNMTTSARKPPIRYGP